MRPDQLDDIQPATVTGRSDADTQSTDIVHDICETFDQVSRLKDAWNDLAERTGDLFCSYDWCEVWWQHFGKGRQLEIHTFYEGGRLVGMLPLFRETLRLGAVRLRTVQLVGCDYTIDAAGLAVAPQAAARVAKTVISSLAERGAWDVLHLGPLRSHVVVSEPITQAAGEHPEVQAVLIGRQNDWLTVFELPETYEGYLQTLPGKDRRDTQRRQRQLQEQHRVQIEAVRHLEQVPRAMDTLIAWHQALWTGKGQRGQFADWPGFEAFHRDIARRMAESGRLLLVTLTIDGEPLGAAYGYHFGPRSHSMIRGYRDDDPWRRFSLGRLLHCGMVKEAIGRGSSTLDDGRGVFDYKLHLGGQLRGERSVTIVRKGWATRLRLWVAMRAAYVLHGLYCRIWFDNVAPRLGRYRSLTHFYIRRRFLAQLFQRGRFGLFGGPKVEALTLIAPPSSEDLSDGHHLA